MRSSVSGSRNWRKPGKGVGRVVDIRGSDGAVRTDQAQIRAGPLGSGAIQCTGEGLDVRTFQTSGGGGVRRFGRLRGDAQVVVVGGTKSFGHFVERFGFHRGAFQRQSKAKTA